MLTCTTLCHVVADVDLMEAFCYAHGRLMEMVMAAKSSWLPEEGVRENSTETKVF
jgi:hypothetical protein